MEELAKKGVEIIKDSNEWIILAINTAKISKDIIDKLRRDNVVKEVEEDDVELHSVPSSCKMIEDFEDAEGIKSCASSMLVKIEREDIDILEDRLNDY